jgi:hypothetical protein
MKEKSKSKKRFRVVGKHGVEGIYWAVDEDDAIEQYRKDFSVVEKERLRAVEL